MTSSCRSEKEWLSYTIDYCWKRLEAVRQNKTPLNCKHQRVLHRTNHRYLSINHPTTRDEGSTNSTNGGRNRSINLCNQNVKISVNEILNRKSWLTTLSSEIVEVLGVITYRMSPIIHPQTQIRSIMKFYATFQMWHRGAVGLHSWHRRIQIRNLYC